MYGGWTLIRKQIREKFQNSKDIQYGTLFNLLENYIPLVLTIYTVTFKRNKFSEYFNAMIRIWVMFLCLQRRHYNRAPLIWLSNISQWKSKNKELYELFSTWQAIFDEYPVEDTHSIIVHRHSLQIQLRNYDKEQNVFFNQISPNQNSSIFHSSR